MHLIIGDFDNGVHASSRVFVLWPDVGKRNEFWDHQLFLVVAELVSAFLIFKNLPVLKFSLSF